MTSTNTVPASMESTEQSSEPAADDSTTAEPTNPVTDTEQVSDTQTGTNTEAADGGTDTADTSPDTPQIPDGVGEPTDADNTSTPDDNDGNNAPVAPGIDPSSSFGQFQNRIQQLTARTLIALNRSLSQGEFLTEQQDQCLGAYDPAIGDPLLSIECEQALATGTVPIYMRIASFENTQNCRASLLDANAEACTVDVAALNVNTVWILPEVMPGQPQRPQPIVGATIEYNVEPNVVVLENLEQNLSGRFYCEFDATTGEPITSDQIGDCDSQLTKITNLIDQHLSNQLP